MITDAPARALALIMVDALRHDYLRRHRTPVLSRMAADGAFLTFAPPYGFEPDAAIFAGQKDPDGQLSGAQFKFSPQTSPFSFVGPRMGRGLDRLPDLLQMAARAGIMLINRLRLPPGRKRDHPTTARIPFRFLRFFDFSLGYYPDQSGFPGTTIFDVAFENGLVSKRIWFPEHEVAAQAVLDQVGETLTADSSLLYLHISDLDAVGHRFGPESRELAEALESVDEIIGSLVELIQNRLGPTQFVVFGDHGMARVRRLLDVESVIQGLPDSPGQDFFYFLDSTMVRFWTKDAAVARRIRRRVEGMPGLIPLQDNPTVASGPYERRDLGDLVYVVEEGVLVHPSFYSRTHAPVGMHGYGPDAEDNWAAGVVYPSMREASALLELPGPVPIRSVYDLAVSTLHRICA